MNLCYSGKPTLSANACLIETTTLVQATALTLALLYKYFFHSGNPAKQVCILDNINQTIAIKILWRSLNW